MTVLRRTIGNAPKMDPSDPDTMRPVKLGEFGSRDAPPKKLGDCAKHEFDEHHVCIHCDGDEDADKVQVIVACPKREGFHGYCCAKIFWPEGRMKRWVTVKEKAELENDQILAVITAEDAHALSTELGGATDTAKALLAELEQSNAELARVKAELEAARQGQPSKVNPDQPEEPTKPGSAVAEFAKGQGESPNQPAKR